MRLLAAVVLAAGLSIAGAGAAGAQTCLGYAPFANGPARVNGDLILGDRILDANGNTYGAGIAVGGSQAPVFGGATVSGTRLDGLDGTARNLGVSGGFRIPLVSHPGTELCPIGEFVHTWGPAFPVTSNGIPAGVGHSLSNAVSLGGAMGHPFVANPSVTLVPFADVRWVHVSARGWSPIDTSTAYDSYGSVTLGAGIMFSKTVTLRPAVAIPIAANDASSVFLISIGFSLGQ